MLTWQWTYSLWTKICLSWTCTEFKQVSLASHKQHILWCQVIGKSFTRIEITSGIEVPIRRSPTKTSLCAHHDLAGNKKVLLHSWYILKEPGIPEDKQDLNEQKWFFIFKGLLLLTIVLKRTTVMVVVMTVASSEFLVRPPSVNCRKKQSQQSQSSKLWNAFLEGIKQTWAYISSPKSSDNCLHKAQRHGTELKGKWRVLPDWMPGLWIQLPASTQPTR